MPESYNIFYIKVSAKTDSVEYPISSNLRSRKMTRLFS